MRSRLPLGKVVEATPVIRLSIRQSRMTKATIIFDSLSGVAWMAEPMQIAHVVGAASVARYAVVKMKAALVWPSASRTR